MSKIYNQTNYQKIMKPYLCLAIESTAHTIAASVINSKGKILSDARDMYQTEKEGLEPRKVADHHKNIGNTIIQQAIEQAKIKIKEIKDGTVVFDESLGANVSEQFSLEEIENLAQSSGLTIAEHQKVGLIAYICKLVKK